jgi:hypothetical protein
MPQRDQRLGQRNQIDQNSGTDLIDQNHIKRKKQVAKGIHDEHLPLFLQQWDEQTADSCKKPQCLTNIVCHMLNSLL